MSTIEVFDPPMCCSTGVCGPKVDPTLATFAGDLGVLAERGASVTRHNLSQEPGAFAEDATVRELLHERGDAALPVVRVNGTTRVVGRYPSRAEMESWLAEGDPTSLDPVTTELIAIAAAVAAHCESCLRFHVRQAQGLGVGSATMRAVVAVAQKVGETPVSAITELAAELLDPARTTDAAATSAPVAALDDSAACDCDGECAPEPVTVSLGSGASCCG